MQGLAAGLLSLLLATESAGCTWDARKSVTVTLRTDAGATDVPMQEVIRTQHEIMHGVRSYFSERGIDVSFVPDGRYDVRIVPRSDRMAALRSRLLNEEKPLGMAWPEGRYAEVYLYRSRQETMRKYEDGFARDTARTIAHELGHLWGLRHSASFDNFMYPELWIGKRMESECSQVAEMHAAIALERGGVSAASVTRP